MFSLRDRFPDGQVVELGGELIDSGHEHMRSLATELGIELDDLHETGIDTETWFFGGTRRGEREVVEAFTPVAARIQQDLATIGGDHDVTYRTPLGAEPLDRLSIAEWLDRAGVSGWFRALLDVGYTTEYGLEIGEQSALNLLLWIDPTPDPFRIYGDSDERYHTRGGNDAFTTALAKRLSAPVETGSALEAVRRRADGTYVCSVRRGSASSEVTSRVVLLALPFTMLREVRVDVELPPAKRLAIDTMGYGTNAKLMVGFTSRPWRERHRSNGSVATDLAFQSTWETSRRQAGAAGILTNFTGGHHGSAVGQGTAAEQAARLVSDLERVFPGASAARGNAPEARFHWPTHPFTRGSYAAFRPGQWTSINGAAGEAVDGLFFAGEHTSVAAQGFMEGACESGQSAAREILAALRVPARSAMAAAIARRAALAGRQRTGRGSNIGSGYAV
jgi:monoamine oxidase